MATKKKVEVILGAVDRASPAFKSVGSSIKGVVTSQAALAVGAVAMGAALLAASVKGAKALASLAKESAALGDRFDKMSQRIGMSTEDLSKWEYAVRLGGGSSDTFEKAAKKLNQTIYDAHQGLATYTRLFDDLGVAYKNTDGSMRSSSAVMLDMADALGRIENQSKRNAIASKMMGRGGADMLPVLQQGTKAITAQFEELEKLGGVMDTDFTKSAAAMVDAQYRVETAWRGMKAAFADAFLSDTATLLDDIAYGIGDLAGEVRAHKGEIRDAFIGMAGSVLLVSDAMLAAAEGMAKLQKLAALGISLKHPIAGAALQMQAQALDDAIDNIQELNAKLLARLSEIDTGAGGGGSPRQPGDAPPLAPGVTPPSGAAVVIGGGGSRGMGMDVFGGGGGASVDGAQVFMGMPGKLREVKGEFKGVEVAGISAAQQIGDQFAQMFAMMMVQGESMGDIFKNLVKSAAAMAISGGLSGLISGLFAQGGTIPKAANGYAVSGGLRGIDSVPILAQHGEEVISRKLSMRLDRFLGSVEVGVPLPSSGGGGSSSITMQVGIPQTRAEFVRLGRNTRRALSDADRGVF